MTPTYTIKHGVQMGGLDPVMCVALDLVPLVFERYGYDCVVTCAVESRGSGLHPLGRALDFDSIKNIPYETGASIATVCGQMMGEGFDIIWHRVKRKDGTYGNWHLHVEYDPDTEWKGVVA